MSEETTHKPMPVHGYTAQSDVKVELVNGFKQLEEILLRNLDLLAQVDWIDKRWLATGRTDMEKAFMAINRSIFRPTRVKLTTDIEATPASTSEPLRADVPSMHGLSLPR